MNAFQRGIVDLARLMFWTVLFDGIRILPLRAVPWVETVLASLSRQILSSRRRILEEELKKSFPEAREEAWIQKTVQEAFRTYVGFQIRNMLLARITPKTVEDLLPIEGMERLQDSLAKGKGVVVLNPHYGPYLLIMPGLGHRGYPLHQIALHGDTPEGRSALDRKVQQIKFAHIQGRMPATFINLAQKSHLRQALAALAKNEIVLVPSTGRGGMEWTRVPFMNRTALLNPGVIKLARIAGAALVPVFVLSEKPFARIVVEEPLDLTQGSDDQILLAYARLLDRYVAERPDQFCTYLHMMAVQTHWDDHPFFVDDAPVFLPGGRK